MRYLGYALDRNDVPRGKDIKNSNDAELVAHVARAGAELGADIIKTNYTGDFDTFRNVVEGCPAPVVMAGGPKTNTDEEFLEMVRGSIDAGGRGVAIGEMFSSTTTQRP